MTCVVVLGGQTFERAYIQACATLGFSWLGASVDHRRRVVHGAGRGGLLQGTTSPPLASRSVRRVRGDRGRRTRDQLAGEEAGALERGWAGAGRRRRSGERDPERGSGAGGGVDGFHGGD
ncbi:hypothetical protein PR202_gb09838 [Eleusine coracana subsp. coracana]|uniref:Uncharacterized protein n=1 Tax=Eleusine coracana subsp. coracana TaxID=191504 RepID=A0AAV5EIV1_ELECO|nr:hypothetical protein PR202_gb09838 [Eleusine coracana subsp. coracana]